MTTDLSLADLSLAWRIEEACLNGWPALQSLVFDGWQLRFSRGHTRRANSISLLHASTQDVDTKIGYCEKLYAAHGLPAIFRLSSLSADDIDAALDRRGYSLREDEACVLYRDFLADPAPAAAETVIVQPQPGEAWLEALANIQGLSAGAQTTGEAIFNAVALPAAYSASLAPDAKVAAVAFGAVHDGIVCVNAVGTDPSFHRQGYARRAVGAILAWAQSDVGARGACLPVMAQNAAGIAFYHALGFHTEISRYAYRRRG
jgi:ribosomal protein S18 acetylase RimI-like enzyme